MHMLGTYVHFHTKYDVSIFNPVARRAVPDADDANTDNDNYARRT